MVSVGVHPLRWLVTYLHELAHVLDWRERRCLLLAELGRPLQRGDGRALWHMDRSHGELWRRQFMRLAEAAIARELFPGNEQAVRDHAASGDRSSDQLRLDFTADPRVDAEELRAEEERAQAIAAQIREQNEAFRQTFRPGTAVHFDAGPRQGVITGELVRVNRQTCTIAGSGVNWHVPHNFIRLGPAPPDARPAARPTSPRDRFAVGQKVTFRHGGQRYQGQVMRVSQKTCTVATDNDGQWRVAFRLLKVIEG